MARKKISTKSESATTSQISKKREFSPNPNKTPSTLNDTPAPSKAKRAKKGSSLSSLTTPSKNTPKSAKKVKIPAQPLKLSGKSPISKNNKSPKAAIKKQKQGKADNGNDKNVEDSDEEDVDKSASDAEDVDESASDAEIEDSTSAKEDGSSKEKNGKNAAKQKKKEKSFTLFVGNIPFDTTTEDVTEHFIKVAPTIFKVRIPTKKNTNEPRGIAFLEVKTEECYHAALALDKSFLGGRRINVQYTCSGKPSKVRNANIKMKNLKFHDLQRRGIMKSGMKGKGPKTGNNKKGGRSRNKK